MWKKMKRGKEPVPDDFGDSEKFSSELSVLDDGLNSQQWTVQFFREDK